LNVLLDLQENPHKPTRQADVAAEHSVSKSSVLKYLPKNKWHPYKVHLIQELNERDFEIDSILRNNDGEIQCQPAIYGQDSFF